ncbi:DUF2274 domain-containing protein [Cupriavidus sp. CV2]|uniref:DUF2274 domain-containing protein n=1 Tax=Cupriavidus ulmosensis TaxID=3065913 RepID=UPI00296AB819|nr:DUF2274 domain-containing protein [Cupriavidus sp. CV2]MDW3688513.1 DUF2274 domain-containing protein [Cupriavidus sp. CV2]
MATLKKFTIVDPTARINLSLRESTRTAIEQYREFYLATYGEHCERGELVEQLLAAWMEQDKDFRTYVEGLTPAQKSAIRKTLSGESASEDKASRRVPASVQVQPPVRPFSEI